MVSADLLSCRSSKLIKLLSSAGYLSNTASSSSSSSSSSASSSSAADCIDGGPEWLIEASPGQRINITLWDFGHAPIRLSGCIKYATVTEVSSVDGEQEKVVCGGQRGPADRQRHVYTSVGNALRIRLHVIADHNSDSETAHTPRFLIHYQGFSLSVCLSVCLSASVCLFFACAVVTQSNGVTPGADLEGTMTFKLLELMLFTTFLALQQILSSIDLFLSYRTESTDSRTI